MIELLYEDRSDFEGADRGLIGALVPILAPAGFLENAVAENGPRSRSPRITGRPGVGTGSSRSSPSSGTCTRTCTTRRSGDPAATAVDLTPMLTKPQLLGLLAGQGIGGITTDGDVGVLQRLTGLLDEPDPGFAIVTP